MKTKIKILHLEDTPADAELVERELKKGNIHFEKLVVVNKTAFEKALKEFSPDIILSDHTLPSFNSMDAIKIMRQQGINIPFILVTATVSDDYAVEVMKAGADDYILKDRLHRLPQAVLNAMDKTIAQTHLQTIFENTSEGFVLTDKDGFVKTFNTKAAQTIYLNSELEITIGSSIYDYIHASRKDSYKGLLLRVLAGEIIQYDYAFERKNGDLKWYSFTLNPAYNNTAEIEGICITSTNITERKLTEQKLYESEAFNKGILSSLSSQIAVLDKSGYLINVNQAWTDFALENGMTSLERVAIGSNYFDVCERAVEHGDKDAARALVGIQSVFKRDREYFEMEYPCHSPIEQRWFVLRAMNFGSDPDKVVISHQNITERKIAENNLSQTSVELQKTLTERNKILDSSLDVICTINANGVFVNVSAASKQIWGYTPEELIGSNFRKLVYTEDIDKSIETVEKITNNIKVALFENRYVHKNGTIVSLLWSVNWDAKLKVMYCIAKDVTERKKLEQALVHERDQFYEIFLKAPSAIGMLKGADLVFDMVNPLVLELIGKTDVIGRPISEVLPELVDQGFIKLLETVYRTGETYIGREELIKLDTEGNGKLTDSYLNFIYQAYRNDEGEIDGIFFFINDITEQVVSRKTIETSEKFFKGVIENSDDMLTIMNASGKTIYASPAVSKKYGYSFDELLNLNSLDLIHPDDAVIMKEFLMNVIMQPGVPMPTPLIRNKKKDGTYIWLEGVLTNFLDTEGINGIISNFRDITERKKADEENKFKANLLNTIGQAAVATDINGIVNYWNKAAEDIYGWTKKEAIGQNIIDLTPSEATIEQATQIMEELRKGNTWSGEFRSQKKDGTNFPALVTDSPIYDENNKFSGVIGISSDITEKKKLEALLDKTNRLARIGSWEIDVEKGTVFWSDITKEIRETDPDFIPDLSTGIGFFTEGEDKQIISQRVKQCIDKGIPWDEELQLTTFKGNLKWVRTIGEAEFVKGKCSKVYGSFQDITDRKIAEEANKANESKYKHLFERAKDAILILDAQTGKIDDVNPRLIKILGFSYNYFIGKDLWEIGLYKDAEESNSAFRQLLEKEYIRYNHLTLNTESGRLLNVEVVSHIYLAGDKKVIQCNIRDITERVAAEQELINSEIRFRVFFENAPQPMLILDVDSGVIVKHNKEALLLLKYTSKEILTKTPIELSPAVQPDGNNSAQRIKKLVKATMQGKKPIFEWMIQNGAGADVMVEMRLVRLSFDNNSILASFTDITIRKNAEQNIIKSELRMRELFENAPQSIFVVDVNDGFRFKNVNTNAMLLVKMNREELLKQSPMDISPELQLDGRRSDEKARDLIVQSMKSGTQVFDWTLIDTKGKEIVCEVRLARLSATNDDLVLASLLDITERRKAEEDLRKNEIRLKEAQAISHTASWEIDLMTNGNTWSDEFYNIFGLVKGTVEPTVEAFLNVLNQDDRAMAEKGLQEGFNSFEDSSFEFNFTHKDGSLKHAYMEWKFEYNQKNEPVRLYGIIQDRTERKAAEAVLEHQNRELTKTNAELDKFVYSTSHDLRAPLTSLLGLINIIDENVVPAETDQKERIGMMRKSIDKLDSFIEDIITYSRNSRTEIEKDEINFKDLINESRLSLKFMEGSPGFEINVEVLQKGKFISDSGRILINLNNLISNAVKYQDRAKPNPFVNIKVHSDASKAVITVKDNGIGIADDKIEKIFDMFYRATKVSKGSGLGLYIVKETITKLNGTVSLESKLNIGSTFTITIPNLANQN